MTVVACAVCFAYPALDYPHRLKCRNCDATAPKQPARRHNTAQVSSEEPTVLVASWQSELNTYDPNLV
ncbi:hypothetical protein [Mycobacterium sp. E2989]|uniref:hypothetical protein n=1 Tax=Mycobacterium sp. E2989 TaxID=1834140 RepID=UPI0012E86ABB|nr:hypothetical protein [Mycobacterium sp. E2989]